MSTKIAIMSDFEYGRQYYFLGATGSIPDTKCVTAGLFSEELPIFYGNLIIRLSEAPITTIRRYYPSAEEGYFTASKTINVTPPSWLKLVNDTKIYCQVNSPDNSELVGSFRTSVDFIDKLTSDGVTSGFVITTWELKMETPDNSYTIVYQAVDTTYWYFGLLTSGSEYIFPVQTSYVLRPSDVIEGDPA